MKTIVFCLLCVAALPTFACEVRFVEPTQYVDGRPIAESDKPLFYIVHWGGVDVDTMDNTVTVEHGTPITCEEIGFDFGSYDVALRVQTQSGELSVMSNIVVVDYESNAPKPVTDLQVVY